MVGDKKCIKRATQLLQIFTIAAFQVNRLPQQASIPRQAQIFRVSLQASQEKVQGHLSPQASITMYSSMIKAFLAISIVTTAITAAPTLDARTLPKANEYDSPDW